MAEVSHILPIPFISPQNGLSAFIETPPSPPVRPSPLSHIRPPLPPPSSSLRFCRSCFPAGPATGLPPTGRAAGSLGSVGCPPVLATLPNGAPAGLACKPWAVRHGRRGNQGLGTLSLRLTQRPWHNSPAPRRFLQKRHRPGRQEGRREWETEGLGEWDMVFFFHP